MDMAADKWRLDLLPAIERSKYKHLLPSRGGGSRGARVVEAVHFSNGAVLKFMSGGGSDKSRAGFTSRVVVITETDGMDKPGQTSRESVPRTANRRGRAPRDGVGAIDAEVDRSAIAAPNDALVAGNTFYQVKTGGGAAPWQQSWEPTSLSAQRTRWPPIASGIAPLVVYVPHAEDFQKRQFLRELLRADNPFQALLVIDECPTARSVNSEAHHGDIRLREVLNDRAQLRADFKWFFYQRL
jgi:hypothetical protein